MDWHEHVETDPRYFRPAEVEALQADASRARNELGWTYHVGFPGTGAHHGGCGGSRIGGTGLRHDTAHRQGGSAMTGGASPLAGKRICVTGGAGFLGSFVVEELERHGCREVFVPRRKDYDLTTTGGVERLFADARPQVLFHLAALVGGIGANRRNPGRFFYDNAIMGIQLIEYARRHHVEKAIVVGTTCSYPKFTPVPFREEALWDGYPEETNAPYGIAKKALLVQCQAYREQYGMNAIYLLPVNLYGPRDNFDLDSSHVIPALIRKCLEAKRSGAREIICWGDGSATRAFLYAADAAEGLVLAAERYDGADPVNLGTSQEVSIRELVELIVQLCGYTGRVVWDATQPNGQPRRCLDTSRAEREFGFRARTTLTDGLAATLKWYEMSGGAARS
jgi:GDP-L-fucose synthase